MKVSRAVARAAEALQRAGVPEPLESALHLAAAAVGCPPARRRELLAPGARASVGGGLAERAMSPEEEARLRGMVSRRLAREPVQHIVGDWDFLNVQLRMAPGVLVPRPETEELAELAVRRVPAGAPRFRLLDVGTGTGALALAILRERPLARAVGLDVSSTAADLARRNAQELGLSARFESRCAALDEFAAQVAADGSAGGFDMIVSNPPYIPLEEASQLAPEVRLYEDPRALFSGADGLDVIRALIRSAPLLARDRATLLVETHATAAQREAIEGLLLPPGAPSALHSPPEAQRGEPSGRAPWRGVALVQWHRDFEGRLRFLEGLVVAPPPAPPRRARAPA